MSRHRSISTWIANLVSTIQEWVRGLGDYYFNTHIKTREHKVSLAIVGLCSILLAVHPAFIAVALLSYITPPIFYYTSDTYSPTVDSEDGEFDASGVANSGIDDIDLDLSFEGIKGRATQQREETIPSVEKIDSTTIVDTKYSDSLYTERPQLASWFAEFKVDDDSVFAVVGEAGLGKTNFLCNHARDIGASEPAFFYNGAELTNGVKSRLRSDLGLSEAALTFGQIQRRISERTAAKDAQFYLFIDGLNECPNPETLRSELQEMIQETKDGQWRFVLSCRLYDWDFWYRDETRMVMTIGRNSYTPDDAEQRITRGVQIKPLSDSELNRMLAEYRAEFNLQEEFSDRLWELCREPFMLRLVAEVYQGRKTIPEYIEPIDLFERYLEERFPSQRVRRQVRTYLFRLADKMLESESANIPLTALSEDREIQEQLFDANILIYTDRNRVQFHFDLFQEFVTAHYVLAELEGVQDVEAVVQRVLSLTESNLRTIPGVIEMILTTLESDSEVLSMLLRQLSGKETKWKTIACSTIRKLDHPSEELDTVIRELARSDNYILRSSLSQSLNAYLDTNGWEILQEMAADEQSWQARETAANVIGEHGDPPELAIDLLGDLAEDFHWRVRRATGYTLHNLSVDAVDSVKPFASQLLDTYDDLDWKTKHAVSILLLGADLDDRDSIQAQVVRTYAVDSNPHVCWLIANYLPRYDGETRLEVVATLADDASPWVRRKLTEAVATMQQQHIEDLNEWYEELLSDPDQSVVIKALREVSPHDVDKAVATRVQELFEQETDIEAGLDIRIAAAYTLRNAEQTESLSEESLNQAESFLEEHSLRMHREMIARQDVDSADSLFMSMPSYLSSRTGFVHRDDPYMDFIDTMSNLIRKTFGSVESVDRDIEDFVWLLADDADEGVKWALVIYLTRYDDSFFDAAGRLDILEYLSKDEHPWVRREVAIACGRMGLQSESPQPFINLLEAMIDREHDRSDPCSGEVLHFISSACAALTKE